MTSWIYRPEHPFANANGMIERALYDDLISGHRVIRSGYVISDAMAPARHPSTGRIHDSKSEFRKDTRAAGCEEVGNDPSARRDRSRHQTTQADVVPDVKRAIEQLKSR